jgi:SAM-dependent methyltransferase
MTALKKETPSIEDVQNFWDNNPLWTGEAANSAGSEEFFEEHRACYIDCFAGELPPHLFPDIEKDAKLLDVGCGIGMWVTEFGLQGYTDVNGVDLSKKSLELAQTRLEAYGLKASLHHGNAEELPFETGAFSYVNCQGVIHHTTHPEKAAAEISRVLEDGGRANISVYYKNIVLRNFWLFKPFVKAFFYLGAKLKGRGRDNIFALESADDIVRVYDGADNPIGLSYTKAEFLEMLAPYFEVKSVHYHYFPSRALPFKLPQFLNRFLDRRLPFMIFAVLEKKS